MEEQGPRGGRRIQRNKRANPRIEAKALRKLRHPSRSKHLKGFEVL